ncbi:dimethyladenosine transferase [Chitinasiproducens palmae]|uniref:Ribosomal RNA small subunit methyltransferase A n=1 Tax=Chitinasiproducens palmae TaxID=1770053 RepID=A0A1H2PN61_9BURK|nr:dimethyladenosine transferase [Chitinasiproducens palmae]
MSRHQGHLARKRFGQNFLVDTGIVASIVKAIAPRPDDLLVEIGPGLAALTEPLLDARGASAHPMHAVELDRDLVARLTRRFGDRLTVHAGDALDFDFGALIEREAGSGDGGGNERPSLRIVGNLPYNISSPLLFHLVTFADRVVDQHFMLQDEVVERMVAEPGSKAYSRLSVMLQFRYHMDKLIDVPPTAFEPPPKVNSAVVRMLPRERSTLPEVDAGLFAEVVGAAFSQRRKMLRNTLGAYRDRLDFEALGFDLTRRAEAVPVDEYVALAQALMRAPAR